MKVRVAVQRPAGQLTHLNGLAPQPTAGDELGNEETELFQPIISAEAAEIMEERSTLNAKMWGSILGIPTAMATAQYLGLRHAGTPFGMAMATVSGILMAVPLGFLSSAMLQGLSQPIEFSPGAKKVAALPGALGTLAIMMKAGGSSFLPVEVGALTFLSGIIGLVTGVVVAQGPMNQLSNVDARLREVERESTKPPPNAVIDGEIEIEEEGILVGDYWLANGEQV